MEALYRKMRTRNKANRETSSLVDNRPGRAAVMCRDTFCRGALLFPTLLQHGCLLTNFLAKLKILGGGATPHAPIDTSLVGNTTINVTIAVLYLKTSSTFIKCLKYLTKCKVIKGTTVSC